MVTPEARMTRMETQIDQLQQDVSEIKTSVSSLHSGQQQILQAMAVNAAKAEQEQKSRGNNGVWVRWIIPFSLSLILGLLAIHSYLDAM